MKKRRTLFPVILLIILAIVISAGISRYATAVKYYTIVNDDIPRSVRIVQLSDLHGMTFGDNNSRLVEKVRILAPEIIVMTGDMFNSDADDEQIDLVCNTIKSLKEIAPVFYSYGQAESEYIAENGKDVIKKLEKAGATILEKKSKEIIIDKKSDVNNQTVKIQLGGVYGNLDSSDIKYGKEQEFLNKFQKKDGIKILLANNASGLLKNGYIDKWNLDIVLSGRTHGGQVRIPFIGGVIDPDGGFFTDYLKGRFDRSDSVVIVSAGLGSDTYFPPRLSNVPEIVCVDIERDQNVF